MKCKKKKQNYTRLINSFQKFLFLALMNEGPKNISPLKQRRKLTRCSAVAKEITYSKGIDGKRN